MSDAKLPFQYWSDPLCIWAFVAQRKLESLLAEHGERLAVDYHVVPVFGSVPHRFRAGSWAAKGVEGRVASTASVAARFGHPEVTGEVWRLDPPASSWAPGAVIKAVQGLESAGEVAPGAAADFLWQLRVRLFVDNQNIARRSVALHVAESAGLPVGAIEARLDDGSALAALFEDHQERERLRIQGSPTYVFDGGRAMLYGNFDEAVLQATVRELLGDRAAGCSVC